MKLIFLGPPGAGKGTLAAKAVDILKLPHISTGAIFRSAIAAQSPLGLKVKAIIDAGKLVDDGTTIELVKERLAQADAQKGYILDGFPRTIPQAEALAEFSKVDKVVNFDIPDTSVLERLGGRRVCRKCGHNFHIIFDKPKKETVCDHCGGEVYTRDDDKPEAVQKRLEVYRAQTAPLIDFYRKKGLLVDVDARPAVDQVVENFKHALA
ncbi:adenylate kinase [Leadbettera azotonutricia]|uniref:Adenylate kinase n=1 Tax=Leadbettera azotonutricia (strain ATCC BAA-888 / DSM 13862 / ZAS-9) TaxID=545695 RepID=F5YFD7_LEAAZ|nr:adenylate kinase [Leadbettera azotonutricia]AEF81512.1 adenylate kinase [Leadbettera azotonutricia ZAS-9]